MRLSYFASTFLGVCWSLVAPAAVPRCTASPDDPAVCDPARCEIEGLPREASAHGKYRVLLRRIHCPEDLPSYQRFNDYGMYTGATWHNYTNLPSGYWVYVYPDWYIWRDSAAAAVKARP